MKAKAGLPICTLPWCPQRGQIIYRIKTLFNYQLAGRSKSSCACRLAGGDRVYCKDLAPSLTPAINRNKRFHHYGTTARAAVLPPAHSPPLLNKQKLDGLPKDIRFKLHCSLRQNLATCISPMNMKRQGGWAFNVVNAADWVPEVPFSIQTIQILIR